MVGSMPHPAMGSARDSCRCVKAKSRVKGFGGGFRVYRLCRVYRALGTPAPRIALGPHQSTS